MTDENVHNITTINEVPPPPPPPSPTADLEYDADLAIRFVQSLANIRSLDADVRIKLVEVQGTIKSLKQTVHRQSAEAQLAHDRIVEITKSQRLI